ncbi:hypothetical protein ACFLXB_04150 [Chloroflexota bacterium]
MRHRNILFDIKCSPISPSMIREKINSFEDSYNNAVKEIIDSSKLLDIDGEVFVKCSTRILKNFGMTRAGPFHTNLNETLLECWEIIGDDLLDLNHSILNSNLLRDRYILEISDQVREEILAKIWRITKKLLPVTMGKSSYGLVGASKILFSVLPEIVLPVDNNQWLQVFKTVDLGDVLRFMVQDIQKWENKTTRRFNELDDSKRLTTIPSVYNVMAMDARPPSY